MVIRITLVLVLVKVDRVIFNASSLIRVIRVVIRLGRHGVKILTVANKSVTIQLVALVNQLWKQMGPVLVISTASLKEKFESQQDPFYIMINFILKLLKIPVMLGVIQVQLLFVKIQMGLSKYATIMDA